jgi:putative tricarboxylic transport membrane protein
MRRRHQVTAAVCLLFAALVAREALRLRLYTPMGPGPGFFPLFLAAAFAVLAALLFLQATLGTPVPAGEPLLGGRPAALRVAAILIVLTGTVLLLEPLGFRLTTLAGYLVLLYALGRPRPLVALLVALAASFGVYHIFVNLLKVALPVGRLGL